MKKLVSMVVTLVALFAIVVPVDAAGAISSDEQRILDALTATVTVNGKSFDVPQSQITQAENYLKQNDLTAAQVNTVVSNIEAVKTLLASQKIDMANVNSIEDLVKALPRSVILKIQGYVTAAADALGLVVTSWNGGFVQLSQKTTSGKSATATTPVYGTDSAVKQTGASYLVSFATIGGLLTLAAGAFVVGRKTRLA